MQIPKTVGACCPGDALASCRSFEDQLHDDITGAKIKLCDLIRKNDILKVQDFFSLCHSHEMMAGLSTGRTPLHEAAVNNSVEMTNLLLECLPTTAVDARNANGNTALMLATKKECALVVRALLEAKASTDIKDAVGRTALMVAIDKGYVEIAQMLLEHGANIHDESLLEGAARMSSSIASGTT